MFRFTLQDNLGRLVHISALVILLLIAVCVTYVLMSAGSVADRIHREDTKLLVKNELDQQIAIVARDQSQISNWDATLEALGSELDKNFVRREITNWLWEDFEIQSTVIIGRDEKPRVAVFKNKTLSPRDGQNLIDQNMDLIKSANQFYFKYRKKVNGGYRFPVNPIREGTIAYAADYRVIDGTFGIIIAQAIVPSEGFLLPKGNPHIMLVFKPVTDEVIGEISKKLELDDIKIVQNVNSLTEKDIGVQFGQSNIWLTWREEKPSSEIWSQSIPIVALMLLTVSLALAIFSSRYGNLLSELKKNEEENRFLALHDALTGLPNRIQFDQALSEAAEKKYTNTCAVLCIDLDRFKAVNDTYGHLAGDTVIATVASRIAKCVDDHGIVARMGGDEFSVLLRNVSDQTAIIELCEDIIFSVSEEIKIEDGVASVGASIGIAYWPQYSTTANLVVQNADKALYQAKQNGRGCVFIADEKLNEAIIVDTEAA